MPLDRCLVGGLADPLSQMCARGPANKGHALKEFGRWHLECRPAGLSGRESEADYWQTEKMPDSTATIRAWALKNGHTVAERGRLSEEVRAAYASAHKRTKPKPDPTSAPKRPAAKANKPRQPSASKPARQAAAAPVAEPRLAEVLPNPLPRNDGLLERIDSIEKQVAALLARVAELEQPKRGFRRHSR